MKSNEAMLNLKKIPELSAQLEHMTRDFRFICVSDIHMYDTFNVGNMSSAERMQNLVEKLLIENEKEKLDVVFFIGDLSMNDITNQIAPFKDGVKYLKENVVDKLPFPAYCLHGNHDCYTDEEWGMVFDYPKNYDVVIGDYAFLCYDTFGVIPPKGTSAIASRTYIDLNQLKIKLDKYKDKNIYLLAHWLGEDAGQPSPQQDIDLTNLLKQYSNFRSIICGHQHANTKDNLNGVTRVQDGSYSYDFSDKPRWSFKHFYGDGVNNVFEHIYVENNYGAYQQPYLRNQKTILNGVDVQLSKNKTEYPTMDKFAILKNRENIEKLLESVRDLKRNAYDESYINSKGESVSIENPRYSMDCGIDIFGKTILSKVPSLISPATLINSCENNILKLKIGNSSKYFNLKNTLKSLPNGVCDSIVKGKVKYIIKSRILNGTENWLKNSTQTNTTRFYLPFTDILDFNYEETINTLSDKLEAISYKDIMVTDKEGIAISKAQNIGIRINNTRLSTQDENGLKAYLTSNPITIYYCSKTVTEENIVLPSVGENVIVTTDNINKPIVSINVPNSTYSVLEYILGTLNKSNDDIYNDYLGNLSKACNKIGGYIFADAFSKINGASIVSGKSISGGDYVVTGTLTTSNFCIKNSGDMVATYKTTLPIDKYEFTTKIGDLVSNTELCFTFNEIDSNTYERVVFWGLGGKIEYNKMTNGSVEIRTLIDYTALKSNDIVTIISDSTTIQVVINGVGVFNTTRAYTARVCGVRMSKNSDNTIESMCAKIIL